MMNYKLGSLMSIAGLCCVGGRPVVHDLTLPDLVARSNAIVILEQVQPVMASEKSIPVKKRVGKSMASCKETTRYFQVKKVLNHQVNFGWTSGLNYQSEITDSRELKNLVKPGVNLEVVTNSVELMDCIVRNKHSKGISFIAERYQPSATNLLDRHDKSIGFLTIRSGKVVLTVDGAVESLDREQDILSAIETDRRDRKVK